MRKLQRHQVNAIANRLSDYSTLFSTLIENANISIVSEGKTAWVEFDNEGRCINFCFNEDFWNSCDEDARLFIFSHETMHIFLNHGKRARKKTAPQDIKNIAADVVVNESLISNYGFKQDMLGPHAENMISIDMIVKQFDLTQKEEQLIRANTSFELIVDILMKNGRMGGNSPDSIDQHDFGEDNKIEENFKELAASKMIDADADLKKMKSFSSKFKGEHIHSKLLFDMSSVKSTPINKWERIIIESLKKEITEDFKNQERWLPSRRNETLYSSYGLLLPSEHETEEIAEFKKKDVWFFLDVSGSCVNEVERFVRVYRSVDKRFFSTKLFVFDETVTGLVNQEMFSYGGGTSFAAIENFLSRNQEGYPSNIFVLTDGIGGTVEPLYPQRWHWFIVEGGSMNYIPEGSNVYALGEFE